MRQLSAAAMAVSPFAKARWLGLSSMLLALLLGTGCGSGGNDAAAPPPPPPPPAGIGPAGGTVNGPGGSSIVVPPNALAANTVIAIAMSSSGAPVLPAELEPAGDMFAITPHGTAFAVAATVTVPFDPADVPAGRTVQLMKTNAAQTGWEAVAGATTSGNTLSAQTSSLSWWQPALVAIGPTIVSDPADVTVNVGEPASFQVIAATNGASISYQWMRGGQDILGATASTYTLPTTSIEDDGARFSVLVTNAFGSVASREALLTIESDVPSGWTQIGGNLIEGAINARNRVRYPSIAVHTDGTIYVAYAVHSSIAQSLQGFLRVSKWNDTASVWEPVGGDLNIRAGTDWAPEWPFIRVASDGNPVVAWLNRWIGANNPNFTNEIVVQKGIRMSDGTSKWEQIGSAPSGVSGGALRASAPILALGTFDTLDQPHVAFQEGICNVYRMWNGSDWLPDPQRACAASNQSGLAFALNNIDTALVAGSPVPPPPLDDDGKFTELRNWISVRFRGAQDNGFFNSEVGGGPVNTARADQIVAAGLTVADFNRIIVAFVSNDFENSSIVTMTVRLFTNNVWSTLGGDLLGNNEFVPTIPHLRIETAFGDPVVAWLAGTSAASRITGRVWDGQTWQNLPSPHDATTNIGHFGFNVAPDDEKLHVVFTERSDANPHQGTALYVRRCDAGCF